MAALGAFAFLRGAYYFVYRPHFPFASMGLPTLLRAHCATFAAYRLGTSLAHGFQSLAYFAKGLA
jgi:hypothetical protein